MRLAEQNIWSCGIDVPRFGLANAKKRTDGQSVSAKGWSFIFVNYLIGKAQENVHGRTGEPSGGSRLWRHGTGTINAFNPDKHWALNVS